MSRGDDDQRERKAREKARAALDEGIARLKRVRDAFRRRQREKKLPDETPLFWIDKD